MYWVRNGTIKFSDEPFSEHWLQNCHHHQIDSSQERCTSYKVFKLFYDHYFTKFHEASCIYSSVVVTV
jgi:hypothetical protein